MFKHIENFDKKKILVITLVSFFIGFSQAVSAYVLSTFFEGAWGAKSVGFFYAVTYIITLAILLNLHKIVAKLGKSSAFSLICLLEILTLCALVFLGFTKAAAFLVVFYLVFSALAWTMIDVILESFSKDEASGEIRGEHLTIFNLGFLFGPFVSTWLLGKFGFNGIFSFILFLNIAILIIFIIFVRKVDSRIGEESKISAVIKKAWKRKNLMKIYYVSFILEAFFALMVIYTPIYLKETLGFSWAEIGRIFTVMLIPFVLLQYPIGFLADKKFGEKEFLIFSLLIMSASTFYIYFTSSKSLFVWAVILFATRIGAALIEVLRDSYFYKQVDGKDVDLINFFRTASPVGYIFATLVSAILLIFLPLKFAFILVALITLTGIYPAFKLKDSK